MLHQYLLVNADREVWHRKPMVRFAPGRSLGRPGRKTHGRGWQRALQYPRVVAGPETSPRLD